MNLRQSLRRREPPPCRLHAAARCCRPGLEPSTSAHCAASAEPPRAPAPSKFANPKQEQLGNQALGMASDPRPALGVQAKARPAGGAPHSLPPAQSLLTRHSGRRGVSTPRRAPRPAARGAGPERQPCRYAAAPRIGNGHAAHYRRYTGAEWAPSERRAGASAATSSGRASEGWSSAARSTGGACLQPNDNEGRPAERAERRGPPGAGAATPRRGRVQ